MTAPRIRRRPISNGRRRRAELYKKQKGRCGYCEAWTHKRDWTIDHRIPISRDGNHGKANLIGACRGCNQAKGSMTEAEYRATRALASEARRQPRLTLLPDQPPQDEPAPSLVLPRGPGLIETIAAMRMLPQLRYRGLLIDCPWKFKTWSEKGLGKSPDRHYPTMPTEDLCRLPIGQLAAADAGCIAWATAPMIRDVFRVLDAWGFGYASMGAWGKQTMDGDGLAFGPGYWFRSAAEFYVLGTCGRIAPSAHDVRNLILAPRGEHSVKPDQIYEDVERLFPGGPWLEVFSRRRRPGWDSFGWYGGKFHIVVEGEEIA